MGLDMEYITVLHVSYSDGTPPKKAMYTYASADLAVAGAHKYIGQYMAAENVRSVMAVAMNNLGGIYANYGWKAEEESGATK